ncbi:MAG: MBL fold metallo-hydrolase [Desulfurococcales archaeon]|nr:MBL fold metallo-hydrolase [Desulfurococcales archaeon]
MSLSLYILGAGGSYPPPGYAGPSLLVEAPDYRLLLDCGDSCAARLEEAGFDPCDVDAVYVSHRHADHWSGLVQLLSSRGARGCPRLEVIAHRNVAVELLRLLEPLVPGNAEVSPRILGDEEPLRPGVLEASLFRVRHQVPTYGVSIREGGEGLLAYTADTAYDEGLAESLRGHLVVVADSTLPPSGESERAAMFHMSVRQAWRLAVEHAGADSVVAFHLSPESLEYARRSRLPGLLVPGEGLKMTL